MSPKETYDFCQRIFHIESMTEDEIRQQFPIGSKVTKENSIGKYLIKGHKQSAAGWILIFDTHQDYAFLYLSQIQGCEETTQNFDMEELEALRPTTVLWIE